VTALPPDAMPRSPLDYAAPRGLLAGLYDEFLGSDGNIRPHWREIAAYFERLGPGEITRRWNHARKILRDNGVAYQVGMPDAEDATRSWELNPIPLRIPGSDWALIEPAVRQRARLLNAALNDLYGKQDLIRESLIPPALVFGSSSYLLPCVGVPVPHDARLVMYAVDLARSPDGSWWVISDSTQAPAGAGYALENRVVLSRVFPEIFQTARIARLGGFFRQMKTALEALNPRPGLPPTVVMLTPGRLSETYFEHAYLTRQLGFTLVEGQDLVVRNDTVYIRTLQGLQRVDVILRHVDDDYCDPLELRDESLLGVPGLMNAIRAGSVTLANSLGSGLVQSPALPAFLPKICERLLGEKLRMPSIASWWCGQSREQQYVLRNLHGLKVKASFDFPGDRPDPDADPKRLRAAIQARPEFVTGQEIVRLSQCPDFIGGRLRPFSVVLRVFAVRNGDDYLVMPGGLTRVADEESSHGVLMRNDGGTKDTWVDLAEAEPANHAAGPASETELRRVTPGVTSRIADSLFWFGRYIERCEFSARMARAVREGLLNQQGWLELSDFRPVLRTLEHFGQYQPRASTASQTTLDRELIRQMLDRESSGSLAAIVDRLRDVISSVRDQVTTDTWRIANQLPDLIAQGERNESDFDLNALILHISALNGVLTENMTHGSAWRFMELGRRIERATYSARLVAEALTARRDAASTLFDVLLDVFDAVITYRQKYAVVRRDAVLDLLLGDESNPRALATQLSLLLEDLLSLPREHADTFKLPEERLALRVLSDVRLLDVAQLEAHHLTTVENSMLDLSAQISRRFFTHLHTSSLGRDVATTMLPDTV